MPEKEIPKIYTVIQGLTKDIDEQKTELEKMEERLRKVEQEVSLIPGALESLQSKILNKMDSDQVETLKEIIQNNKANMSKLIWLAIGSIFSILTAMALSFLTKFIF